MCRWLCVQYVEQEHAEHLRKTLQKHYEAVTINWDRNKFCGMNIKWNYNNKTCNISMNGYVIKHLEKFTYRTRKKKQHSPSKYTPPKYGCKIQMAKVEEEYNQLTPEEIKELQ